MADQNASLLSKIVTAVKELYVETSQSDRARKTLTEFFLGFSVVPRGACMTLHGASGSGKTTLLKSFLCHDVPKLAGGEAGRALYVEVPSKCTLKSVAQAILQALGDPAWNKGSGTDAAYRIGRILNAKGYRLLALDECQHMIESRNNRVHYDVADWIKSAINSWSIPVILSGLPKIQEIIAANDQLDGRRFRSAELGPMHWDVKNDQRDYRFVLKRCDEALPFPQRAGLEDVTIAKNIHYLADGLLGKTTKLIILAAMNAARGGLPAITTESIGRAFEELRGAADDVKGNPFSAAMNRPTGAAYSSPERLKPSGALHRELSTKA